MTHRLHRILTRAILPASALALPFTGCSLLPAKVARRPADYVFIRKMASTEPDGGLRLAVKDFIDVKGEVTSAGSEYLYKHGAPANADAACLKIARERGVRIVGKTNASEFGVTSSGINEFFGAPRSPLILDKKTKAVTGGSSSGSAVAVSLGLADVAFGTDTGGSVRIPAAWSGVYGLKTTHGLVPVKGVFTMAQNLDTVGPLARDIPHLVQGMGLLQRGAEEKYRQAVARNPRGRDIRVGRLYVDGTDPAIDQAVDEALKRAGFRVVRLDDKFKAAWEQAQKEGKTVAVTEAWMNDYHYRDKRGVSTVTKGTLLLGEAEYRLGGYEKARQYYPQWRRTLSRTFNRVDLIAMPTVKQTPPKIPFFGTSLVFEALTFDMQNTVAFNFSGNPAIAIPVPMKGTQVPLTSLQLIGPRLSEAELLNAGRIVSSNRP